MEAAAEAKTRSASPQTDLLLNDNRPTEERTFREPKNDDISIDDARKILIKLARGNPYGRKTLIKLAWRNPGTMKALIKHSRKIPLPHIVTINLRAEEDYID